MRRLLLLLPSLALLLAGCPADISTIKIHCENDGQCRTGQICGEDSFCRPKPVCLGRTVFCHGVCASLDTPLNCGKCDGLCADGEICNKDNNDAARNVCAQFCNSGLSACSGACVNKTNDRFNCGACGTQCPSGQACQANQCRPDCLAGLTKCGTTSSPSCVEINNDKFNCGTCGNVCPAGQACQAGACRVDCLLELTNCGATCVDKQTDPNNCSACGKACQAGQACKAGVCQLSCQSGLTACAVAGVNTCVDPQTDRRNCGTCAKACLAGEICTAGSCVANCPAGEISCGGACANVQTDPTHCGDCNTQCGAGQTCSSGHCALSCQPGLSSCDVTVAGTPVPTCVDKQSDSRNCGSCGNQCPSGQVCSAGGCQVSCQATLTQCGSACVNLASDPNNCGTTVANGCNHPCLAGERCQAGACTASCLTGSVPCPVAGGSTCVNLKQDNANCNACGASCGAGTACANGACVPTCGGSSKLCGAGISAACKDIKSDPNNCGDCGSSSSSPTHICPAGQVCSNGSCQTTCGANLTLCIADGLCHDLGADPANCGTTATSGCGHACQSGETCQAGLCKPTCGAGLTLCGSTCTNLAFDPQNCGACGSVSPTKVCGPYTGATGVCSNSSCKLICQAGFGDCNGTVGDGCEISLTSDPANCGACGNVCGAPDDATGKCAASKCQGFDCKAGFGNCDGASANGCESLLASDAAHCGACAGPTAVCTGTVKPFCGSGACAVAPALGIHQNVSATALGTAGFTLCYSDAYNNPTGISLGVLTTTQCPGNDLIVGCRAAGSDTVLLAAHGLRADVFAQASPGVLTATAYGVSFYFDGASSMGFAPTGATVTRAPCDTAGTAADSFAAGFGSQRLCWLTSGNALAPGLRCGAADGLGGSAAYERLVFSK